MAVHPGATAVEQGRPAGAAADGLVDSPADRRRQRNQDNLAALAAHTQHPVAVLFTQIGDISPGGFEDAQAEQPKHGQQGEVAEIR
jgi:hypothetical protein